MNPTHWLYGRLELREPHFRADISFRTFVKSLREVAQTGAVFQIRRTLHVDSVPPVQAAAKAREAEGIVGLDARSKLRMPWMEACKSGDDGQTMQPMWQIN